MFPLSGNSSNLDDGVDQSIGEWYVAADVCRLRSVMGNELDCFLDWAILIVSSLTEDEQLLGG